MKIPYGYVLVNEEIIVQEEKADVVRSIFGYYLAGASLGKIVDMLHVKGIPSPSGDVLGIHTTSIIGSLITSVVGAIVLLWIFSWLSRKRS